MTRENKLALVVGFGLILFVGILISDHFSVARQQSSAKLMSRRIDDPLVVRGRQDPDLIALKPEPAVSTSELQQTDLRSNGVLESMTPEQRSMINRHINLADGREISEASTLSRDVQPGAPIAQADASVVASTDQGAGLPGFVQVDEGQSLDVRNLKFHDVRNGESMYSICKRYYGSTELIAALAQFNNLSDPAALREGRRLVIPPAEVIGGTPRQPASRPRELSKPGASPAITIASASAASEQKNRTTAGKPVKTYTVKSGDSLSGIAQRVLGDRDRWRDLHKLNKNVIEDPDKLREGMVLKVG